MKNWDRLKSLVIHGIVELYDSGEEFTRIRYLLYRKHKQYKRIAPIEEGESLIIKLIPKKVIASNI